VRRAPSVRSTASDQWRAALALSGEIDLAMAPDLRTELERHLDAGRRVIRVDMSEVSFIDSSAIGELIRATEWCRREHGSLILTGVPLRVRRLIALGGLDAVLLVDTVGDGPAT
jgi:anti-sigma B factor antagonist